MRKLNVKLFLVLTGASILLAGGVVLCHYLQSGRIAGALLVQAERAEKQSRLDQSVKFLSRYLEFVPEDLEQRARLGRLLASEQLADTPKMRWRAFFVLEDVLRRDPSRDAVRRQLSVTRTRRKIWRSFWNPLPRTVSWSCSPGAAPKRRANIVKPPPNTKKRSNTPRSKWRRMSG